MDDTGLNERALTASALRIPITRFFNRCLAVFDMPRGHALDSARRALEASTEQTGRSGRRCNLLGSWENEESPVTRRFNSSRGIFDEKCHCQMSSVTNLWQGVRIRLTLGS